MITIKVLFDKLIKANDLFSWLIVFLVVSAEAVLTFVNISIGVIIYLFILVSLLITAIVKIRKPYLPLYSALTLIPLIRIISASLPLSGIPEALKIVAVSVPLFITGVMVAKFIGITPTVMGFRKCNLRKQLLIALLGVPLGLIQYYIIQPDIINRSVAPEEIILWVIAFIICVGLLEEFLFRGILFNVAYKSLGNNKAMLFISLLYAALTISSKSLLNVLYVFLISLLFCRIFIRKKCILGISLAHGIINITVYLICPLIFY